MQPTYFVLGTGYKESWTVSKSGLQI